MKQFKQTFLLIVLMSMIGAKGYAQEYVTIDDIGYDLSGTEATLTYGRECSGDVVIPGSFIYEGTTYTVTSIGDAAFYQRTDLTSVTIPNNVTSIGEQAFEGCSSLTSVTMGNGLTTIGDYAFYGCSSLPSITIPNSVTSIGKSAFSFCSGLTSVTMGNGVTTIGDYAFDQCTGLTSVTIGNSVTTIGESAFFNCNSLTTITIPNSVTSIGDQAFEGCSSLTSFKIPNGVTSIGDKAFYECNSLTSVVVDLKTPLDIGEWAFSNRGNATLYIPQGSGDAYKNAEYWKDFKEIVEVADFTPCATPTISCKDGKLLFECETEGVEFVSNITLAGEKTGAEVVPPMNRKVTVYAKKEGCIPSEKAMMEIDARGIKGDVDGDGTVDVNDVQTTINIILKK